MCVFSCFTILFYSVRCFGSDTLMLISHLHTLDRVRFLIPILLLLVALSLILLRRRYVIYSVIIHSMIFRHFVFRYSRKIQSHTNIRQEREIAIKWVAREKERKVRWVCCTHISKTRPKIHLFIWFVLFIFSALCTTNIDTLAVGCFGYCRTIQLWMLCTFALAKRIRPINININWYTSI